MWKTENMPNAMTVSTEKDDILEFTSMGNLSKVVCIHKYDKVYIIVFASTCHVFRRLRRVVTSSGGRVNSSISEISLGDCAHETFHTKLLYCFVWKVISRELHYLIPLLSTMGS